MKMRTTLILTAILAAATLQAAETTKLSATQGSKIRIEGTSNIHDWRVESKLIGGSLEVGPNFPLKPGQAVEPGKVEVKGEAFIPVRSLKSLEKDGRPYSDKMDEIMYEKLNTPRIYYRVTSLTLKEAAKSASDPYLFDSEGELAVNGVTNKVSMPVKVTPLPDSKWKIAGETAVKMTDFKIDPPAPAIALGMIKTGNDVKLLFEWMVKPAPDAAK